MKRGEPWFVREDWTPYYDWLESRLFHPGRWAVIPDAPGAPSQLNDGLLNDWPFGRSKGAPLWHMDGPIDRFLRLADQYDRVCIGWIGEFDPKTGKVKRDQRDVGCEAYFRRMDELTRAIGNRWPVTHMMRGVLVAREFPFVSVDATSLAQNGHRYDCDLPMDPAFLGRRAYADRLEAGDFSAQVRGRLRRNREAARGAGDASQVRRNLEQASEQLGLW